MFKMTTMYKKEDMNTQFNQKFSGYYKVGVVNPETNEVQWHEEGKNLILNQGMDEVRNRAIPNLMAYGISGVGTRPNSYGSGVSHITQSGALVFLKDTAGAISDFTSSRDTYAALVQVGDMIKYQSLSESMVTSVLSDGYNLLVTPSYTFTTPQSFTIWKTSQTGLESEVARSSLYIGGTGFCGTTSASNAVTHRRTYDFSVQVSPVSYNEIGVGWSSTPSSATVFSRILLNDSLLVPTGFRLRIIYDLQTTWNPTSSVYSSAGVGNWPVSPSTNQLGTQSLQRFLVSEVNTTTGVTSTTHAFLDPYYINDLYPLVAWVSTNSDPVAAFESSVDRSVGSSVSPQGSAASYVNGTYVYDKTYTFPVGTANGSMRSIGLGGSNGSPYNIYNPASNGQVYVFRFDQDQFKNSSQTLSFTFRWAWGRTLS